MVDLTASLEVQPLPSSQAPLTVSEGTGTDRIRKLAQRFQYVWNHPFWTRWRTEAEEDEGFASGERQWPEDVRRQLEAAGKACLTINEIRPILGVLTGYERQTRMDIKAAPVGKEDLENATLLSRLLKKVQADEQVPGLLSEGFKVGCTGGLAVWFAGVDYTDDPVHGRVSVQRTKPGEVCWDPDWQRYDLQDARDLFWTKLVSADLLKAHYPEKTALIDSVAGTHRAVGPKPGERPTVIPARDPGDAYAGTDALDTLLMYDPLDDAVRVVEAWYRTWETVWLLVNRTENSVTEVPEASLAIARELAKATPESRLVRRQRRKIEMCVFLPEVQEELESGTPFENDTEDYPFVPFVAYREGKSLLGVVRNLKDPQREVNRRRSSMTDNVKQHGSPKWKGARDSVENPGFFEGGSEAGNILWVRPGKQAPEEVAPPGMPEWIWRMDQVAKQEMREISLVNAPLQGQAAVSESGIKVERMRQAGLVGNAELFDNYRRSRLLLGKRLAKRIQQVYTGEMTVRLQSDAGGTEFVTINTKEIDAEGRVKVVRDIPSLKYDVEMADSPFTPTARAAALDTLLDLLQKMPALAPALVDIILEMTDIPNRDLVLARVRALMQGGPPGGPPGGQPASPGPPRPTMAGPTNGGGLAQGLVGP